MARVSHDEVSDVVNSEEEFDPVDYGKKRMKDLSDDEEEFVKREMKRKRKRGPQERKRDPLEFSLLLSNIVAAPQTRRAVMACDEDTDAQTSSEEGESASEVEDDETNYDKSKKKLV